MPFSFDIPAEAVQLMDGDEAVMPAQGDVVSITIEGTVESVGEGSVSVYANKANGVDLGGDMEEPGEMPDREGMLAMLQGAQL